MSKKLLKSLSLPNHLLEKLNANHLYTIKDVLSKCPMDLVKLLSISLAKVDLLIATILTKSVSFCEPVDALTLFKRYQKNHVDLNTGLDTFDTLLNSNELLKTGILTEVCGPPGVGKTQFLLKTCSTYLLDSKNSDNSVIYIDTENNLSVDRYNLIEHYPKMMFFRVRVTV